MNWEKSETGWSTSMDDKFYGFVDPQGNWSVSWTTPEQLDITIASGCSYDNPIKAQGLVEREFRTIKEKISAAKENKLRHA